MNNLRAVLKAYREAQRLTLKSFSRRLGISPMDLCRLESGRVLSAQKMARIAHWLFISDK